MNAEIQIPLNKIKFVLLDMDGTLLDRYFDDYFWEHLVPERYAEKRHLTFGKAKEELFKRYKAQEKTLNWTDLDFWSKELDIDIPALKEQVKHLIEVHPNVENFLKMLKRHKKKVFLVTNAHYKSLDIKLKKTEIGRYFDSVLSSFDVGYPKGTSVFWKKAEKHLGFVKEETFLIDDTEEVLKAAKEYGIKYIILKAKANSKEKIKESKEFITIVDFGELMGNIRF